MNETLLTIGLPLQYKAILYATSRALGMSGMGAVARSILDGRLPPIPQLTNHYTSARQQEVFQEAYTKYINGEIV